jgi:rubrerythrin
MAIKNAMTADFLRSAYGGESMAHMRYIAWGEKAGKDGYPNIERLFRGISYAEQVHANNHFRELDTQKGDYTVAAGAVFGIGSLVENLQGAINGELHEVEQMYPVYMNTAEFQDEKGAKRSFHYALEAEKIHAKLFKDAQDAVKTEKDLKLASVNICPICGHTILDDVPDKCPVCGAQGELYKKF